ncbi:hypothetical protein GALMADRAFT_919949 [Galerina marginata CBS 339.88]|uniref:Uncharacterized protein n=1 Tax=Galerina marginata (strain CBS 339.88) TaxID=685588 RepID=A0A067SER7_GALM3|nr:hypothetical protein GALMADRAFT_919949 [Galerina marginata CBS 339.88]
MSALSDAIEKADISAALNSTVMFTFLMGIYTTAYFSTIYLYSHRKGSRQRMVVVIITALYSNGVLQLGLQWWYLKLAFVNNGTTRGDTLEAFFVAPLWLEVISDLSQMVMLVLADVLLIWRCFFVWNRSIRVIVLPVVLLVAEVGISIASVMTSMAATTLIAFRIHSISNQENTPRGQFKHIIEIVVQSAVIYSLALLLQLASNVHPIVATDTVFLAYSQYAGSLAFVLSGLVPTVMVARICISPEDNTHLSTLQHVSRLQFQGQSTNHDISQVSMGGIEQMEVEAILPPAGEKGSA